MDKMTPEQMADLFDAEGNLDLSKVPAERFEPGVHITTRQDETKHWASFTEMRTGHGGTLELLADGQVTMILAPQLWSLATLVTPEMSERARQLREGGGI